MSWKIIGLVGILLAGCTVTERQPMPLASHDACGASKYAGLKGAKRAEVEATAFSTPMRIVPRQSPVTLDFQPTRINFALNRFGRVVEITCG